MTMMTIFSTPKPFDDPFIATIQRNAIQSWLHLGPQVEVFLIGDEIGLAEVAKELKIYHIPEVERNQWGTPLVRSLFHQARMTSASPIMALVNADIILMPDFLKATRLVAEQYSEFLIVGRRWGLDIDEPLDFSAGWQDRLKADGRLIGQIHPVFSIDYFIFSRYQYQDMPEFVIGRPQWDNWMIYHAHQRGWPVVEATPAVMVVHQNHDYRHLPGGKPPHGLEEGKKNRRLAGGERTKYTILDANRIIRGGRIRNHPLSLERILRSVERWLMKRNFLGLEWRLINFVRRLRQSVGEQLPEGWVAGGLRKKSSEKTSTSEGN
jgi:hypothetical protein